MEKGDQPGSGEWRLGFELGEHAVHPGPSEPERPAGPDPAAARLDRPLFVLTAEHLGWILIAAWTIATRLAALGARPLTPAEARGALDALGVAGHAAAPAHAISWVVLAQSGIFASLGVSDFNARLFAGACGILLVAAAYAMRPYLGRAGALALAVMLAISPTLLWYSRAGTGAIPAAAFAMVAVALLMASIRRPTMGRAVGMGAAAALAISAGAVGIVAAISAAAAAIVVGLYHAIAGGNTILRIRVWWTRRAAAVISAVIVAVMVWIVFTTAFFRASLAAALRAEAAPLIGGAGAFDFVRGLAFYAPILIFYELAIVLAAVAGLAAIVTVRVRSTFAVWLALWAIISAAAYAAAPGNHPQFAVGVIVPAAMLGAVGFDWIFRSAAWNVMGYMLAVVAAAAIYSQALTSAAYPAPDATEAPWARHALLYWSEPATTWQARAECENAARESHGGTVDFASSIDAPAVRWYLRGMHPAQAGSAATVTVDAPGADAPPEAAGVRTSQFVLEQDWSPSLGALTPGAALRYYLAARAWTPVGGREIALTVRLPEKPAASGSAAPMASPSAAPSASVSPAPSAAATITPTPTAPAVAASATPAPVRTPEPSAVSSTTAASTPSPTPTPSATATPVPTAIANPSASRT